ncbi:DNA repair protein RAD5A-like [Selaginella moellendorffii]|uniref:DNA repair protein RAD5A-like n=1 Tax=Selaginella moellendorffii TaxID=88036 RepID=UPI000D1C44F6|nr:DNA repair protein RAD5A-like [Selaginella moellendorffii]|eukprot:XP_024528527.1 DNA repair protein RAD5A-like [Selaginella moellendorffii]
MASSPASDDFIFFPEKKPRIHYDTLDSSLFSSDLDFVGAATADDSHFLFCDVPPFSPSSIGGGGGGGAVGGGGGRPRKDPSSDPVWFEFGAICVPIDEGEGKEFRLPGFDVDGGGGGGDHNPLDLIRGQHKALLDELALNEAQGQMATIATELSDRVEVKVFLKKERGEEPLVLNETLQRMFPGDLYLQQSLAEVEEMRQWGRSSTDWMSFSGLLRDLENNVYCEAEQPSGLTVPLRPYQLQSLQFMLDAEQREGGLLSVNYQELHCPQDGSQLMYSSSLAHLMDFKEGEIRGGFLCEEMGLGKTIEILALILANPCPVDRCDTPLTSRGTLVVCPVSIVGQWANEVKSKLDPACNRSIYMYHGSKRIRDPKKLAKFDLVITTYATLGSDFSKATQATRHGSDFAEQFCPLLSVDWWRVVLDESHTVKDPAPLHSRACTRLKANRRWCCTGTPINTSIYDLYGQFLFLKLEPLDNKNVFRKKIGRPYERHCKNDDQTALLWTLNKIMVRHTKQQKFNGRELLMLPPKTEQDLPVTFTPEERAVYDAVYQKVITKFEQFRCWGPTVVSKNILQIMSLLLPLRRLCSGGFVSNEELVPMEKKEAAGAFVDPSIGSLPETHGIGECGICSELMECPTKTPCGHWFCSECVISVLGVGIQPCPTCSTPISVNNLRNAATVSSPATDIPPFGAAGEGGEEEPAPVKGVRMESKLRTLLADLAAIRADNSGAKVLIFSQFMQTVAWLKCQFKKQGINYRFISGDMPMKKRAQAIEAFQKESPTTVFLLSIRTGAVGITLTAASHVYMLEPCLNPALEEQAVGRCWRMGQERPVVIKRLYVENSVEANILKLFRSRNFGSSALSPDGENRGSKTGKAGLDVAGCIRTDKQNLRLNEFELLFS